MYGDLPEAHMSMFIAPKYKTQQEIYDWMYKEVEDLRCFYSIQKELDELKNSEEAKVNIEIKIKIRILSMS